MKQKRHLFIREIYQRKEKKQASPVSASSGEILTIKNLDSMTAKNEPSLGVKQTNKQTKKKKKKANYYSNFNLFKRGFELFPKQQE